MTEFATGAKKIIIDKCVVPTIPILEIHANFNLRALPGIALVVESVEGVEMVPSNQEKYKMNVFIGKAFCADMIIEEIGLSMLRYLEE